MNYRFRPPYYIVDRLTERPGLPVRIIVNRDRVLRPYQPLFFNRGTSR